MVVVVGNSGVAWRTPRRVGTLQTVIRIYNPRVALGVGAARGAGAAQGSFTVTRATGKITPRAGAAAA